MTKRVIGVVTGSRADFGLLQPLLTEIERDPQLKLLLFVTGMHFAPEFGMTLEEITAAGFCQPICVETQLAGDGATAMSKSMGLGLLGFADVWQRPQQRPDILVALGDRYEILAAVLAAVAHRIPVAHISGGEVTEGALDDVFRHSISKLSHLHFVGAAVSGERLLRMGELPERVFMVGDPAIDNIRRLRLLSRMKLAQNLGIALGRPLLAVTYHPVTRFPEVTKQEFQALQKALADVLFMFPAATIVITRANADPAGREINRQWQQWVDQHSGQAHFVANLGLRNYLSLVKQADAVIGNSSSGLSEAPALRTPSVNLGARQKGRDRAWSVFDCPVVAHATVLHAIELALRPSVRRRLKDRHSITGDGFAARRMVDILRNVDLIELLHKPFNDTRFQLTEDMGAEGGSRS